MALRYFVSSPVDPVATQFVGLLQGGGAPNPWLFSDGLMDFSVTLNFSQLWGTY